MIRSAIIDVSPFCHSSVPQVYMLNGVEMSEGMMRFVLMEESWHVAPC